MNNLLSRYLTKKYSLLMFLLGLAAYSVLSQSYASLKNFFLGLLGIQYYLYNYLEGQTLFPNSTASFTNRYNIIN